MYLHLYHILKMFKESESKTEHISQALFMYPNVLVS